MSFFSSWIFHVLIGIAIGGAGIGYLWQRKAVKKALTVIKTEIKS